MDEAFEDARVEGWKRLEATITLPDPDDRHVVAAALRGRADAIITTNVRHYPADTLEPLGIEVIHPDNFLLAQLDLAPPDRARRPSRTGRQHPSPSPHSHRPRRPPRQSRRARVRRRSRTPDLMGGFVIAICDLGVTSLRTR
jgi:hypothetical protein